MAAIVNNNNNENTNKKTILTQYANKYNYLDKLILSWDEIDEHEAHDSSDLIRPKQISSTKVADREDAFGRVKKTVIPVPDEHHYKQNIISICSNKNDFNRSCSFLLAKFHMMDDNVFCSCKDDILCFVVLFVHGVLCL